MQSMVKPIFVSKALLLKALGVSFFLVAVISCSFDNPSVKEAAPYENTSGDNVSASKSEHTARIASPVSQPSVLLEMNVKDELVDAPLVPVSVKIGYGKLEKVSLKGKKEVNGSLSKDGLSWTSDKLSPWETYTLDVTAKNNTNQNMHRSLTFSTKEADNLVSLKTSLPKTVGVGYPLVVNFSQKIKNRAAAEKSFEVSSSKEIGPASWYWVSDKEVVFRPKAYWPENARITFKANTQHLDLGDAWVKESKEVSFQTSRMQVTRIDDKTHEAQVYQNQKLVRTMPVSMGQNTSKYKTRSGTKVIMSIERKHRMDSSTVGITGDEAYDLVVDYALRITNSGEFFHSAPWSVKSQGKRNVSHGCVNLSPRDAKWLFENSVVGDPVETQNTGRLMESYNGLGGVWNISWENWQKGSSLS